MAQFRCPETYPESERNKELSDFMGWVMKHHSDWTLGYTARFRYAMLNMHHCTATLDAIEYNLKAEKKKP